MSDNEGNHFTQFRHLDHLLQAIATGSAARAQGTVASVAPHAASHPSDVDDENPFCLQQVHCKDNESNPAASQYLGSRFDANNGLHTSIGAQFPDSSHEQSSGFFPTDFDIQPDAVLFCFRCATSFETKKGLKQHIRETCERIRCYACSHCAVTDYRRHRLKVHDASHHPGTDCPAGEHVPDTSPKHYALGCAFCPYCTFTDLEHFTEHHLRNHCLRGERPSDANDGIRLMSLLEQPATVNIWRAFLRNRCHFHMGSFDPFPFLFWSIATKPGLVVLLEGDPALHGEQQHATRAENALRELIDGYTPEHPAGYDGGQLHGSLRGGDQASTDNNTIRDDDPLAINVPLGFQTGEPYSMDLDGTNPMIAMHTGVDQARGDSNGPFFATPSTQCYLQAGSTHFPTSSSRPDEKGMAMDPSPLADGPAYSLPLSSSPSYTTGMVPNHLAEIGSHL